MAVWLVKMSCFGGLLNAASTFLSLKMGFGSETIFALALTSAKKAIQLKAISGQEGDSARGDLRATAFHLAPPRYRLGMGNVGWREGGREEADSRCRRRNAEIEIESCHAT